jgi:hypothetical protein
LCIRDWPSAPKLLAQKLAGRADRPAALTHNWTVFHPQLSRLSTD